MLFLKRFATFVILVPLLCGIFFFGAMIVGGAISGAAATTQQKPTGFDESYAIGQKAGEEFGRKYGAIVLLGSAGGATLVGGVLGFTGLFPWCRRRPTPPPLR